MSEQVEALVHHETGSLERGDLAVVKGTGEYSLDAPAAKPFDLEADLVRTWPGPVGHGAQDGYVVLAAPRRHL